MIAGWPCGVRFHDDRSASASVNIELGKFKCFACEARGDAAALVMEREGLSTYRAGAELARQIAGVPLQQLQGGGRSASALDFW